MVCSEACVSQYKLCSAAVTAIPRVQVGGSADLDFLLSTAERRERGEPHARV